MHAVPPLPRVLVESSGSRQIVAAASREAVLRGLRVGMSLAQARAICPELEAGLHEPDRDHRALQAMARWLMRFSPIVSVSMRPADFSAMQPGTHALFLDVTGCERLFGGLPNLVEQLQQAIEGLGVRARIAIAPNPAAAWAVASGDARNGVIVLPHQLQEALRPLPTASLQLEGPAIQSLCHLGIETIGQLLDLPRASLPSRFGASLLYRIDQTLGRIPDPLIPLDCPAPIEACMEFGGVVNDPQALWKAFGELISQVVSELARRGLGARIVELTCFRPYESPLCKSLRLSRPSRNSADLLNLLRCAMEDDALDAERSVARSGSRADRCAETIHVPAGFDRLRLGVALAEPLADEQLSILEAACQEIQRELERLVDRLALRLGDRGVLQARLAESHVPENACRFVPPHRMFDEPGGCNGGLWPIAGRPLHLLPRPEEIRVTSSPSHDQDGRPICMICRGRSRRLVDASGPERIAGQWWEGRSRTRDYFCVEDETARRWWIFRVLETGQWYVHGMFE